MRGSLPVSERWQRPLLEAPYWHSWIAASAIRWGQKIRRVMAEGVNALVNSDMVAVTEKAPRVGLVNPLARSVDQPIHHQSDSQIHNPSPKAIQPVVSCTGREEWPQWSDFKLHILALSNGS